MLKNLTQKTSQSISHSVLQLIHSKAQGVCQSLNGGAFLLAGIWGGLLWTSGNGKGSVPMTIAGFGAAIGAIALFWQSRVGGSRELAEPDRIGSACAGVAELADAPDLGSGAFGCRGSSPLSRTMQIQIKFLD